MFLGVSSQGINREVVSILECAELNRRHGQESLAIPELCLLQMARKLPPPSSSASLEGTRGDVQIFPDSSRVAQHFVPSHEAVCEGFLPGLRYVVRQHRQTIEKAKKLGRQGYVASAHADRIKIERKPNSWENPNQFAVDPYGSGDFFCKLCHRELSNAYLHW
jgi:hypothetical protein